VPHITQRLFCVGRLDAESSGLVLLTNDGGLTQRLTHPSFEVPKTYEVIVRGAAKEEALNELRKGVYLAEGRVRCDRVTLRKAGKSSSTLEIEIHQGVNREIRRVLAKVGLPVSHLKRTGIATLGLGQLRLGHHRKLTAAEIQALYDSAAGSHKVKPHRSLGARRRRP
jgi:23S rRNA pseudouridine2605 synthase